MPRNPSELARLEDELEYWREKVKDLNYSKRTRESFLCNVRHLEKQLGIESQPYNSEKS